MASDRMLTPHSNHWNGRGAIGEPCRPCHSPIQGWCRVGMITKVVCALRSFSVSEFWNPNSGNQAVLESGPFWNPCTTEPYPYDTTACDTIFLGLHRQHVPQDHQVVVSRWHFHLSSPSEVECPMAHAAVGRPTLTLHDSKNNSSSSSSSSLSKLPLCP